MSEKNENGVLLCGGGNVRGITVCRLPYQRSPFVHGWIDTAEGPRDVWLRDDGLWSSLEADERNLMNSSETASESDVELCPLAGKWGYASDETAEYWHGACETREEAIVEAKDGGYGWIGQYRAPSMPWDAFNADWFGDQVVNQEDWLGDYAESSWDPGGDDLNNLEERVQAVIRQWCIETGNLPKFGIVERVERIDGP